MSPQKAFITEPILRPRMPELDTVRGIAILAVVLFHGFDGNVASAAALPSWQRAILSVASQGWAGVNLFFVLSGFLITGILLDSVGNPRYFARFYSRRVLRIFPVYYLLLVLLFLWCYLSGAALHEVWPFVGLSVVYLSNLAGMFGVPAVYPLLWSLSVEEHFYLIWPAVIRLLTRKGVAIVALLICLIEPALRWYALAAGTDSWWAGLHRGGNFRYTWMVADGLALGALLALLARSSWGKRDNFLKLALAALLGADAVTLMSKFFPEPLAFCVQGTMINYFSLAIVAGALWLGTGEHRGWANIRLLAFYGYISYGLYLVHSLIYVMYDSFVGKFAPSLAPGTDFGKAFLSVVICVPVATAIAYFSRVTYEEFFLRLKDRKTKTKEVQSTAAVA